MQAIRLVSEHLKREEQAAVNNVQESMEQMDVNGTPLLMPRQMNAAVGNEQGVGMTILPKTLSLLFTSLAAKWHIA